MKVKFAACALVTALLTGTAAADALVDGNAEAGKAKSTTCSACHGADGNSVNPMWPSIAGQHAPYIVAQLAAFKNGTRVDPLMSGQAMALSEQDMRDLGAYYAGQQRAAKAVADASTVDKGRALYVGGDSETGVTACLACHGPIGTGNPAASYPALRGQYAAYTAKQLRAYASGARKTDITKVMRDIAARLTEDDIAAVSSYIQGLSGAVTAAE
jgi:cytochrome c553